ncbi:DUF7668 domain-containing protein [Dyadobacter luticola]|uniref:DUF7668 domain-containing protein n=1 Tax=Dyadobacter luticola TaxID=1979387 RepID=A0A5R9KL66_9BACT|nr:hypothetical protein [Dyadobacter luticola]TLU96982.1 hypothetical protein FEN17_27055 [Dyadobacter luticola]
MRKEDIVAEVKKMLELLVLGHFELAYDLDYSKILNVEAISDEIVAYPGHLTMPPESELLQLDIYETNFENQVWIDIPLWFDDTESDLTLGCTICDTATELRYSIQDIHVL